MKIYNVGRDELNDWDWSYVNADDFEWFVYSYEADTYEGYGEAVALGKDGLLHLTDLGHCSCYGPMESAGNKGTITVEEFLREKDNVLDYEAKDEVESKVRMLLNE